MKKITQEEKDFSFSEHDAKMLQFDIVINHLKKRISSNICIGNSIYEDYIKTKDINKLNTVNALKAEIRQIKKAITVLIHEQHRY